MDTLPFAVEYRRAGSHRWEYRWLANSDTWIGPFTSKKEARLDAVENARVSARAVDDASDQALIVLEKPDGSEEIIGQVSASRIRQRWFS